MEIPFIPSERLRVFISSAQSNEGVFAWSEVRHRIKDCLKECIYLNPFIIEDVTSATPSNQFYQRQLLRSDIVVLLVKGEVRKGSATEYALATKNRKPLLVYFLEDGSTPGLSVVELKNRLQASDYCTYRPMNNFDSIEQEIRNDVIENVIRYYQDMPLHSAEEEPSTVSVMAGAEIEPSKQSTPTKTAIGLFRSSYDHIFDLLDVGYLKSSESSDESEFHHLGIVALDWLATGSEFSCDEDILRLIESTADLYGSTNWLAKRWDAIRFGLAGDPKRALDAAKQALTLAKMDNLPKWIINDILIDCRNIENEVAQLQKKWMIKSEIQAELDASEAIVYLPVLDRYLGDVYAGIEKEELRIRTASPNTRLFGTSLASIIGNTESYFFSAILYGSYTHMLISRKVLTSVLYKFGELTEERTLRFSAIKLLVLRGDTKEFNRILQHQWDQVYSEITSSANDMWALAEKAPLASRDSIRLAVIAKLGLYFSDQIFEEAVQYLENCAPGIYWGTAEDFFECISQNIQRIDPSRVVVMITGILKDKRYHLGGKISRILLELDVTSVDPELQVNLKDALIAQIAFIVKNNGTPQIIAALEKQNQDIFSALAAVPENGLTGIEKVFYDINMGNGSWKQVLIDEITTAKSQFDLNNSSNVYHYFFERPYTVIKQVIRQHYSKEMDDILVKQFFPLCVKILNSKIEAQIKSNCIDCLCDALVFVDNGKNLLSEELVNTIDDLDPNDGISIIGNTKGPFACRVLMLKIIAKTAGREELIEWCFSYARKSINEKIALAECIEQYLCSCNTTEEQGDSTILSIVLQCFEDDYFAVRKRACSCLVYMLNTKFRDWAERKFYEASVDSSPYVRSYLLNLCKKGKIVDECIRKKIIDILRNDANYAIRIASDKA